MAKLVWRVKLVTELEAGEATEVEVARIECDEQAGLPDLGLRLAEAKQLTSALQAEIVPAELVWGFWCQAFFIVVRPVFYPFQVSLFGWRAVSLPPACIQEVSRAEQRSTLS